MESKNERSYKIVMIVVPNIIFCEAIETLSLHISARHLWFK